MTLADFRDELTTIGLEGRQDVALTDARKDRYINFAYRHMCRPAVRRFEEVKNRYDFSLVTNTNEYVLSTALVGRKILGIADVTYYENATVSEVSTVPRRDLKPRNIQWMNKRGKTAGKPSHFAETGVAPDKRLILDSLPTAAENGQAVRVNYWGEVDALSLVTDTTVLADYWDLTLVVGSIFFAKYLLGYREEAVADGQLYARLINETEFDLELGGEDTGYQNEVESEPYMETSGF